MHGQPPAGRQSKVAVRAEGGGARRTVGGGVSAGAACAAGVSAGGGRGRGHRTTIVRDVMQKQGLSLPAASKCAKEHNLC